MPRSCVLVTGGAGFIGRSLVPHLVSAGYEVSVVDVETGPLEELAHRCGDLLKLISGDASEIPALLEAAGLCESRPACVVHLAALLSADAERSPWRAFRSDVQTTAAVLEASRLAKIHRVVFTSSIAAYGGEGALESVAEDAPLRPRSFYGISKVFGELWGMRYSERFGMTFRALRLPAVIGPGRRGGGVSAYASMMIESAVLGKPYTVYVDKDVRIPLIYIDDAVRAIAAALEAPGSSGIYNVGGVTPTPTAWEIYLALERKLRKVEIVFDPDPLMTSIARSWPRQLNDERARRELGWRPLYNSIDEVIDVFMGRLKGEGALSRP